MTFTEVGYTGGSTTNATYPQVCSGMTGHAEAVLVKFDPKQVSLPKILDVFWDINPARFPGLGKSQYRSAIFYFDDAQKRIAEAEKKRLESEKHWMIFTEITKVSTFWRAEEYHQNYNQKHSGSSICR